MDTHCFEKLCGSTANVPTTDQAEHFAAEDLPTSFDLTESHNDQTLGGRSSSNSRLCRLSTLARRCGIPIEVEFE